MDDIKVIRSGTKVGVSTIIHRRELKSNSASEAVTERLVSDYNWYKAGRSNSNNDHHETVIDMVKAMEQLITINGNGSNYGLQTTRVSWITASSHCRRRSRHCNQMTRQLSYHTDKHRDDKDNDIWMKKNWNAINDWNQGDWECTSICIAR